MSVHDELEATYALLRHGTTSALLPDARPARTRVATDAVTGELLGAVIPHFPAAARVLSAMLGETLAWAVEYQRSSELSSAPSAGALIDAKRLAGSFPAFVRRIAPGGHALSSLLGDALDSELRVLELTLPHPDMALLMFGLRGPLRAGRHLPGAAEVAASTSGFRLAAHATLATYDRDVAALGRSATSPLAGFLSPAEWIDAIDRHPWLFVRAGRYTCVHVLLESGAVRTIEIGGACAEALARGDARPTEPEIRRDLVRLGALSALTD
jgi:hypothetical protein